MKNTTVLGLIFTLLVAGVFAASGPRQSDSAVLQGTWKGKELSGGAHGTCTLVITGDTLAFRGADANEWYKGTFTLKEDVTPRQIIAVITDCPAPQYNGKTAYAIYRLENGVLTFTGNEPGNPEVPASFQAAGARSFAMKKEAPAQR